MREGAVTAMFKNFGGAKVKVVKMAALDRKRTAKLILVLRLTIARLSRSRKRGSSKRITKMYTIPKLQLLAVAKKAASKERKKKANFN